MGYYFVGIILLFIASCATQSSGKQLGAKENEEIHIECPRWDGINIDFAVWKHDEPLWYRHEPPAVREYGFYEGQLLASCRWTQNIGVKEICEGKEQCKFKPSRFLFGDCGYNMFLHVTYHCSPCSSFDGVYNSRKKRSTIGDDLGVDIWQEVCKKVKRKTQVSGNAGGSQYAGGSAGTYCPHPAFEAKHVLYGRSDTVAAAENFAKNAHSGRQNHGRTHTEVNTVYYVGQNQPMTYEEKDRGANCQFLRTATKYLCQYDRSQTVWRWECYRHGQAYAKHDKFNGHLVDDWVLGSGGSETFFK